MKVSPRLLSLVAVSALSACTIYETRPNQYSYPPPPPPPPQPAYQEVPAPIEQPVEQPRSIADGQPAGLHSGAPEAYWVWHDGGGWHVRTTTTGAAHRFQGRVWALHGDLENVRPTRLEWNDRIRRSGNAFSFDLTTAGSYDGFDFWVAEGDCAQFTVLVDGRAQPDRVIIGAGNRHPTNTTFRLCS